MTPYRESYKQVKLVSLIVEVTLRSKNEQHTRVRNLAQSAVLCFPQVRMNRIALLVLCGALVMLLAENDSYAERAKSCSADESVRARRDAAHAKDWNNVLTSFRAFEMCDSGRVAEEYSYAISRLLAHDWDHVGVLLQLARNNEAFKQFVLRHINENFPEEEAQSIVRNARERCPGDGKWLCTAIVDY